MNSYETWAFQGLFGTSVAILSLTLTENIATAKQSLLEEVIVTAPKRESNFQDVSVSVTAFSGDVIEQMGFTNVMDAFSQTANVKVPGASFTGQLTVRGDTTLNDSLAGEGSVALYFDEVYRPTAQYNGNQLLDVERMENLRGPQGTLFGRNSTSGLAHTISRKPTEESEEYLRAELGENSVLRSESVILARICAQKGKRQARARPVQFVPGKSPRIPNKIEPIQTKLGNRTSGLVQYAG